MDLPYFTEASVRELVDKAQPGQSNANPWGFVEFAPKKGCPREKVTLVVRAMPDIPLNREWS